MELPAWAFLNCYALLLAGMLLHTSLSASVSVRRAPSNRTYIRFLIVLISLLIMDSFSRLTTTENNYIYVLMQIGNFYIFAIDPLGYLLALNYLNCFIESPDSRSKFWHHLYLGFFFLNLILVTISECFHLGWFYYCENLEYHRGRFFMYRAVFSMLLCLLFEYYAISERKRIQPIYRRTLLAFPIVSMFFGFLQTIFVGVQLQYNGLVFACIMLYIHIQSNDMSTDYLTGAGNRRRLDDIVASLIDRKVSFSAILIDLDSFKQINDTYGHKEGDSALQEVYHLLAETFRRNDTITRFGGDEFCVISDISNLSQLELAVAKLRENTEEFNARREKPYAIHFSIGYAIYDPLSSEDYNAFLKRVDSLMYQEKALHHKASSGMRS